MEETRWSLITSFAAFWCLCHTRRDQWTKNKYSPAKRQGGGGAGQRRGDHIRCLYVEYAILQIPTRSSSPTQQHRLNTTPPHTHTHKHRNVQSHGNPFNQHGFRQKTWCKAASAVLSCSYTACVYRTYWCCSTYFLYVCRFSFGNIPVTSTLCLNKTPNAGSGVRKATEAPCSAGPDKFIWLQQPRQKSRV